MKKLFLFMLLFSSTGGLLSQENLKELEANEPYENIRVQRIAGDSLSTQFVIWVKDTVRTHQHRKHSESIYVLEGDARFYIENEQKTIGAGDFLFIPKGSWHSVKVTSEHPLKVISTQSPEFTGADRVFKQKD